MEASRGATFTDRKPFLVPSSGIASWPNQSLITVRQSLIFAESYQRASLGIGGLSSDGLGAS